MPHLFCSKSFFSVPLSNEIVSSAERVANPYVDIEITKKIWYY